MVRFQYATSAMLALPYDHCLVLLDVPITVIVSSLFLTSLPLLIVNICFECYIGENSKYSSRMDNIIESFKLQKWRPKKTPNLSSKFLPVFNIQFSILKGP